MLAERRAVLSHSSRAQIADLMYVGCGMWDAVCGVWYVRGMRVVGSG